MIVDTFNRRSIIAKHVREMMNAHKQDSTSIHRGFNANLDPGFEIMGASADVVIGRGAVVAHFATTADDDDSMLQESVARGEYFQMSPLELRTEM